MTEWNDDWDNVPIDFNEAAFGTEKAAEIKEEAKKHRQSKPRKSVLQKMSVEEFKYILTNRLLPYIKATKAWFSRRYALCNGNLGVINYNSENNFVDWKIKLYYKLNKNNANSIVKGVKAFCFCFTKDLSLVNLLNFDGAVCNIAEAVSAVLKEGLVINGCKVIAKSNTHLMGTSKQVIILIPEKYLEAEEQYEQLTVTAKNLTEILAFTSDPMLRKRAENKLKSFSQKL